MEKTVPATLIIAPEIAERILLADSELPEKITLKRPLGV